MNFLADPYYADTTLILSSWRQSDGQVSHLSCWPCNQINDIFSVRGQSKIAMLSHSHGIELTIGIGTLQTIP